MQAEVNRSTKIELGDAAESPPTPRLMQNMSTSMQPMQSLPNERAASPYSELLHEILSHSPHAGPFPIDKHRDRRGKARDLDATNRHESVLEAVGVKPVVEEQRKDKAMEDVCENC